MVAPVILIETQPRRASDGAVVPLRLAGLGGDHPYTYAGEHWRAGVTGLPRTVSRLEFDGQQLGGGGVAQAAEVAWSPGSKPALADVAALVWKDAPIAIRVGPAGTLPPVTTRGIVLDDAIEGGSLKLALADDIADLKRPLLVDRYAGTGGLEGPVEWKDLIRPRAWGPCFNVLGRLADKANNIWFFADPRRQLLAFDQVRDRGVAATAVVVLGSAGSAEATLAALVAAAAPAGGCVVAPSIAAVKWWTVPAGDLRADLRGETAGGYADTAPAIAARIVAARSTLAFADGAIAAASAARPAPFGAYVESDSETAAAVVSQALADVSLSWLLVGDRIVLRRWEWTASQRVARSEAVKRTKVHPPVTARLLGYRRNHAPMQRADLAAIVLAQDIAFADGSSLNDLRDQFALAQQRITDILSDGKITAGSDKRQIILEVQTLSGRGYLANVESVQLGGMYGGDPTYNQRVASDNALAALGAILPAGFYTSEVDSVIPNPTLFYQRFNEAYSAVQALTNANAAYVRDQTKNALNRISDLATDSLITAGGDKQTLIGEYNKWAAISIQSHTDSGMLNTIYGGDPTYNQRLLRDQKTDALNAYLGNLNPAWNNTGVDTPVDGTVLRVRFEEAWAAVNALVAANSAFIRDRQKADQDRIAAISADSVLSAGSEKQQALIDWNAIVSENSALVQRYQALGSPSDITAAKTAADAAIIALSNYLTSIPNGWSVLSIDSPIDAALWRSKWGDAYAAIAAFAAAITGRKGDTGNTGPAGAGAFTLVDLQYCFGPGPNSVTKRGGGEDWNAKAATAQGYRGGAAVSGKMPFGSFVGLTTDPGANFSYDSIDYGLHISTGGPGQVSVFRNGALVFVSSYTVAAGARGQVTSDAGIVRYTMEGHGEIYSHPVNDPNDTLYGVFSLLNVGATISDITFTPAGSAGASGQNGASAPDVKISVVPQTIRYTAPPAAGGVIQSGPVTFKATIVNATGPVSWASEVGHQIYGLPGQVDFSDGGNSITISEARMHAVLNHNATVATGRWQEVITASAGGASYRIAVTRVDDGKDGTPGTPAPLLLTQWSADEVNWHSDKQTGDVFKRLSNDNGATWGPSERFEGVPGAPGANSGAITKTAAIGAIISDIPLAAGQIVYFEAERATRLYRGSDGNEIYTTVYIRPQGGSAWTVIGSGSDIASSNHPASAEAAGSYTNPPNGSAGVFEFTSDSTVSGAGILVDRCTITTGS